MPAGSGVHHGQEGRGIDMALVGTALPSVV